MKFHWVKFDPINIEKDRNVPMNQNKVWEKTTNVPISNGTFKLEELGQ